MSRTEISLTEIFQLIPDKRQLSRSLDNPIHLFRDPLESSLPVENIGKIHVYHTFKMPFKALILKDNN